MAWTRLLFVCALAAAVAAHKRSEHRDAILDVEEFTDMMVDHLKMFGSPANPGYYNASDRDAWMSSREYITKEFKQMGLETELQCFSVQLAEDDEVMGCNVIGVSPGETYKERLVVGAHYDSLGGRDPQDPRGPLRENGAGVATLIEVARAYETSARWKGFKRNFPVIFVAFDLATIGQAGPGAGQAGAQHFVEQWLPAHASLEVFPPKGAFVLDSIATYNTDRYSQRSLPSDFSAVFPEGYQQIHANRQRGNFLAAVTTADGAWLCHDFATNYQAEPKRRCKKSKEKKTKGARKSSPFRLQELVAAESGLGGGASYEAFVTSDTRPFWEAAALPTVLLTDMGAPRSRVIPEEERCAPVCPSFASPRTMAFLHETYSALGRTLLDKQTTEIDYSKFLRSSGSVPAVSAALVLALLAALGLQ